MIVSIFKLYNRALFRKQFYSMRVYNAAGLSQRAPDQPTLCLSNHCNWWDGICDFLLTYTLDPKALFYIMVKEVGRFPLLTYVGAFSVEQSSPIQAIRALDYAAQLMEQSAKTILWIYPQGKVTPQDARPLEFSRGVAHLIKKRQQFNVIPVAKYYAFTTEDRPELLVRIGRPMTFPASTLEDRTLLTCMLETTITEMIDQIKTDLATGDLSAYQTVIQGFPNPFKELENDLQQAWETMDSLVHPVRTVRSLGPQKVNPPPREIKPSPSRDRALP